MRTIIIICTLLIGLYAIAFERTIEGKVVSVTDGDTIKVKTHQKKLEKIRLTQIDTPEKKQPWGKRAKQALSDKVFGKIVKVDIETTDRYGRLVGTVWYADNDINREMFVKAMPGCTENTLKIKVCLMMNLMPVAEGLGCGLCLKTRDKHHGSGEERKGRNQSELLVG